MKFYALVNDYVAISRDCNNIISQSFERLKESFLSVSEVRCNSLVFPCRFRDG